MENSTKTCQCTRCWPCLIFKIIVLIVIFICGFCIGQIAHPFSNKNFNRQGMQGNYQKQFPEDQNKQDKQNSNKETPQAPEKNNEATNQPL